jgi:hypothetical protein
VGIVTQKGLDESACAVGVTQGKARTKNIDAAWDRSVSA